MSRFTGQVKFPPELDEVRTRQCFSSTNPDRTCEGNVWKCSSSGNLGSKKKNVVVS